MDASLTRWLAGARDRHGDTVSHDWVCRGAHPGGTRGAMLRNQAQKEKGLTARQRMTRKRGSVSKWANWPVAPIRSRGIGSQDDATGTASSGFLSHRTRVLPLGILWRVQKAGHRTLGITQARTQVPLSKSGKQEKRSVLGKTSSVGVGHQQGRYRLACAEFHRGGRSGKIINGRCDAVPGSWAVWWTINCRIEVVRGTAARANGQTNSERLPTRARADGAWRFF
ncbi:hypothetical protein CMUS01_04403 [Colletotrichum musicola]|uniref:Uncharacterized protein n=1 Tax=Colletotrichum musicola TaxID=2175873 RepID=A0A8H6KWK5_9PEZI|nr:hypothetical protein CMUS01_04403 [Colletotrichum musicola]